MNRVTVITTLLGLLLAGLSLPARAMEDHGMMKTDKMADDGMQKPDGMMKDGTMDKEMDDDMMDDGMMKKDEMMDDGMKKDKMMKY